MEQFYYKKEAGMYGMTNLVPRAVCRVAYIAFQTFVPAMFPFVSDFLAFSGATG